MQPQVSKNYESCMCAYLNCGKLHELNFIVGKNDNRHFLCSHNFAVKCFQRYVLLKGTERNLAFANLRGWEDIPFLSAFVALSGHGKRFCQKGHTKLKRDYLSPEQAYHFSETETKICACPKVPEFLTGLKWIKLRGFSWSMKLKLKQIQA